MLAQQPTFRAPSQIPGPCCPCQICCKIPYASPPHSSLADFDVGSQPHLTPRYAQGVAAMTTQQETALSLPSQSAFCSLPAYHPRLVSSQQTQLGKQSWQPGICANRLAASGPASSCCAACGRAYESQTVGIGRPDAFPKHVGNSSRAWSTCGTWGSSPQAKLAGSTSRALGRMAVSLRYLGCP